MNDEDDKENIDPEVFWLRNELYNLKMEEKQLLLSETAWLNDAIMDAAQRLICKTLGKEDEYQSVLNWQKKRHCKLPSRKHRTHAIAPRREESLVIITLFKPTCANL